MKKSKYVLFLLIVFILIAIGIFITNNRTSIKQNNQDINAKDSVKVQNVIRDTIPPQDLSVKDSVKVNNIVKDIISMNWKTYNRNDLGIEFKYPKTWTKYGEESKAINRTGEVMSIMVNLIDTISQSTFFMEYHLAPYGAELYKNALVQINSSKSSSERDTKQIVVAGNKAIESIYTMSSDIKGNIYDPPLRIVYIIFLDKLQTGEFVLRFKTPLPDSETEIAKFQQLLSTMKFIN